MKNLKLFGRILLVATFVTLLAASSDAQLRTFGKVVGIVDGKTVTVAVPAGDVTVELQYIDVPESGQSLHSVVKEHVRGMLAGKAVELQTRSITRGKITGKLVLDGVDVSRQLLRDGAAWHLSMGMSGQSKDEFAAYAESESLARGEKRGVWSIADLEPAWAYRARKKEEAMPAATKAVSYKTADSTPVAKRKSYWSDENPWLKNPGGLAHGFNAASQTGFLSLTMMGVRADKDEPGQKTAVDITYYYTERGKKGRTGYFQVTVVSAADKWRFLTKNSLTLEIDDKKIVVGKAKRETETTDKLMETLTYRLGVPALQTLVGGAKVQLLVGEYVLTPDPVVLMLLNNMLQAAK
ncbi:MAG TPA: thermonuclease family protein [Pyrinomonadaceae bacterium]|nr:thermonuclease family protein [Pyrinomonadaceae bacterium]